MNLLDELIAGTGKQTLITSLVSAGTPIEIAKQQVEAAVTTLAEIRRDTGAALAGGAQVEETVASLVQAHGISDTHAAMLVAQAALAKGARARARRLQMAEMSRNMNIASRLGGVAMIVGGVVAAPLNPGTLQVSVRGVRRVFTGRGS
jgi:hypothetical protein